jgi:hypothetical protein
MGCSEQPAKSGRRLSGGRTKLESKAEFAVRSEANELESLVVGFAVDQHEIRPNMAVTEVLPSAAERMIVKTCRQRLVSGQRGDHVSEQIVQFPALNASLRTPVIPL